MMSFRQIWGIAAQYVSGRFASLVRSVDNAGLPQRAPEGGYVI